MRNSALLWWGWACWGLMVGLAVAGPPYELGLVPQYEQNRLLAIWRPIVDAIAAATGVEIRVKGSVGFAHFERQFRNGEFDFCYLNPYHYLIARQTQKYVPLVRDHAQDLQGILVVRRDGPLTTLMDLKDQVIAFPAVRSLGASLLVRDELQRAGVTFQPRYVQSHDSVYLNVVLGQAAAGGGVIQTLQLQPESIRNALRWVYRTQPLHPHPLVAHPRVEPQVRAQVRAALLAMGDSEQGRALLAAIPMQRIGVAVDADYQSLEALKLDRLE